MIITINNDDSHKTELLDNGETRLTYYFKNPIVLNDEHDMIINDFHLQKRINSQIIEYENELASVFNNSLDREILPRPYNTNVEIVSVVNVILYEWDGSAFQSTDARATVSCIATQPDLTTGQIQIDTITTQGTGFIVNNFLYIDKDDLTNTFNTYTNRYAEIKITELEDDDVVLTLGNYANRNINKATTDPINERTYDDVVLYEDDGAGWYQDSGVRANVEVALPYSGATFANINILSITNGGSGITLNQILYIDKFFIITGEPTMTYTVRFAEYQVTSLVNGLKTTVLSANVEILANPREIAFVNDNITNVPLLKLESGNYVNSGSLVNVGILANPTNDNKGKANISVISNGGRGFLPFETYYIDKDYITQNNNTYSQSSRYASYVVNTTTNNVNLEVVFLTNYGFNTTPLGDYYYDVPDKNTRIYINLYNDQTYGNMARIRYTEGIRQGFAIGDEITIPSNDIVDISTGLSGWNKTNASGDLKLSVLSLTASVFYHFNYEIYLENIFYNTTKYFNSSCNANPLILNIDPLYKYINGNNYVLSLTPQIIQELKFIVNREIEETDNIMFSITLKNNSLLK
tara:strand:- start:7573 stop:9315 length:1743 start_codon:yes stop_codon:yes gene_type:complete